MFGLKTGLGPKVVVMGSGAVVVKNWGFNCGFVEVRSTMRLGLEIDNGAMATRSGDRDQRKTEMRAARVLKIWESLGLGKKMRKFGCC